MAGPWFTVHDVTAGWRELASIQASDGVRSFPARVEAKVRLVR